LAAPISLFALDHGRIRLADAVFVYLERTVAPQAPLPPEVPPRAYGLSPTGISPSGSVVAAVAPGEAVWLGFQAVDPRESAIVRVRVDRPEPLDAVTGGRWDEALTEEPRNYLLCPPDSRLSGVRHRSGYVPFGVRDADKLSVFVDGETPALVPVELVPPAAFTHLTGVVPEPLDPDHAYKGWRLP
jgi:hypothetical protein